MREVPEATSQLLDRLAESELKYQDLQIEHERLEEAYALQGDLMARRAALFNQFVEAWKDGRVNLKKPSIWARLFS